MQAQNVVYMAVPAFGIKDGKYAHASRLQNVCIAVPAFGKDGKYALASRLQNVCAWQFQPSERMENTRMQVQNVVCMAVPAFGEHGYYTGRGIKNVASMPVP